MTQDDPEKVWDDYYARKRAQRIEEVDVLTRNMQESGVTEDTVLALDFVHFSKSKEGAEALSNQLSENYEMKVAFEKDMYFIKGTTRPYGMNLSNEQHKAWVEFMADVAQSHNCVFSTWLIEAPSLKLKFSSEAVASAS
ncbi:hypothetical protein [Reinekea sp. G2M2-21]|uniref:hypothetical protein n=1 Tax=Reinekea sp. G2M2-21 TaxID=2788942 RepID=UPI0018A932F7|nr:hypothetical protein [Reinekea sp. G2M2-21]